MMPLIIKGRIERGWLLAAGLFVIALNVLAREAIIAIRDSGWIDALNSAMGGSYVVWLALVVCILLLLNSDGRTPIPASGFLIAAVLALVSLVVVPSGAVSWLTGLGFAGVIALVGRGERSLRQASILLAVLCGGTLTMLVVFKLFSAPLLAIDGEITRLALKSIGFHAERTANFVNTESGAVLLLKGCSFLPNLLIAFVAWLSIRYLMFAPFEVCRMRAVVALLGGVLLLNTIRLGVLAIYPGSFDWLHGTAGQSLFEVAVLVMTGAVALFTVKPS